MFAQKKRSILINFKGIILIIAGAGVGCAPLQQAPLVYTSSHVIGVKIGVAPTQPESLEAVIGYKDLDAAYAPVAVSNPYLDKAMVAGNRYDKELYEIKEIYGIYGTQASAAGTSELLTPEESRDMKVHFERFAAKQNAVIDAGRKKETLEKAQSLKSLADQLKKELSSGSCKGKESQIPENLKAILLNVPSCIAGESRQNFITTYAALSDVDKTTKDLEVEEAAAQSAYEQSSLAEQAASKKLYEISEKVKGALEKLASIQKRDAISVYGSFDADTSAEAANIGKNNLNLTDEERSNTEGKDNGVSVKVGKVFSTGVAAQNISEAQKIVASAVVVSSCINAIGNQAAKAYPNNGNGQKEFIQALIPECFKGQDK